MYLILISKYNTVEDLFERTVLILTVAVKHSTKHNEIVLLMKRIIVVLTLETNTSMKNNYNTLLRTQLKCIN